MSRKITTLVREPDELFEEIHTTLQDLFEGESDLAYSEIFDYIDTRISDHSGHYGQQKELGAFIKVLEEGTALELLQFLCGPHALNEIYLLLEEQATARYITNEADTEA
jgi:hypothetical protein